MKELIITADDFGLSSSVNAAVLKGWRQGILTGASLMVGGEAFDEAVAIARENPGLHVGLHLTLVQGRAMLKHKGLPALTDREGKFTDDPVMAGMRYFFLKSLRKQLETEIEEQIVRFKGTGLPLTHIDGHLNMHMHPVVFDILSKLMRKHDITSFRLTRERLFTEFAISRRRLIGKLMDAFIFGRLAGQCTPYLKRFGITCATEVKGLLNSGRMTEDYIVRVLSTLQEGLTEIYLHPGELPCQEMLKRMPDYRHEDELFLLTSEKVRSKMAAMGIVLRNYRGERKAYA